jgi:hypothetical protein
VAGEMVRCRECMVLLASRATSGLALPRAQALPGPGSPESNLAHALDQPNQVRMHAVGPIRRQLLRVKAIRRYPIRKVTTPVPVEGAWRVAHSR